MSLIGYILSLAPSQIKICSQLKTYFTKIPAKRIWPSPQKHDETGF